MINSTGFYDTFFEAFFPDWSTLRLSKLHRHWKWNISFSTDRMPNNNNIHFRNNNLHFRNRDKRKKMYFNIRRSFHLSFLAQQTVDIFGLSKFFVTYCFQEVHIKTSPLSLYYGQFQLRVTTKEFSIES